MRGERGEEFSFSLKRSRPRRPEWTAITIVKTIIGLFVDPSFKPSFIGSLLVQTVLFLLLYFLQIHCDLGEGVHPGSEWNSSKIVRRCDDT